jgi:NADPH-dependent 2,4-dienoyl-CoA reductase/sulfur reductase-like enzyme
MTESIEIAIIGAGPGGVAAAVAAAEAGAQVTLIEEQPRAGGQYYKQLSPALLPKHLPPSLADTAQHGRELLAKLKHPKINLRCQTLVWHITPERVLELYAPSGGSRLQAKKVIIASGAYERVVPFVNWTLPGVVTVGAAQLMLKGQGVAIGEKILIAGAGPLLQLAAAQLIEAGAKVAAIVELQSRSEYLLNASKLFGQWKKIGQGVANQKRIAQAGVPIKFGYAVKRVIGATQVEAAVIARVDSSGKPVPDGEEEIAVDAVCLNFGFVPATELTRLAGCDQYYDQNFGSWATVTNQELETTVRGIFAVGEVRGIGGVEASLLEGRIAGYTAARQLGYAPKHNGSDSQKEWLAQRAQAESLGAMFAVKSGLFESIDDDVIVCRCEEVTAGAIRAAARAGATKLNSLKTWNRCGMGRCQGRTCGPIIAQIIAAEEGVSVESVGMFTARPPIKPVPLGVVGVIEGERPTGPAMEDHLGYGRAVVK